MALETERLAQLLVLAQPFPLDSAAIGDLARYWMHAAALAQYARDGNLQDPEIEALSTWLDLRNALYNLELEDRLGDAVDLDSLRAREMFDAGDYRAFAHALRRVNPETSSSEQLLQKRTAERLLSQLAGGGSWDDVVQESEDDATASQGGFLGVFRKGELPSTLDRRAFTLEPGQASPVTQTAEGYHILYRPRWEELSAIYASELRRRMLQDLAEERDRDLLSSIDAQLPSSALRNLKRMTDDAAAWLESTAPLVLWTDGRLAAGTVARYLLFLPSGARSELGAADPQAQEEALKRMALREIRFAEAKDRGLDIAPRTRDAIQRAHADEMEYWTQALGLGSSGGASPETVDAYMERVAARLESRAPSPLLQAWLLRKAGSDIDPRGILAAGVQAQRMLEAAGRPASGLGG